MITEIILIVFAILYYLFSIFFFSTPIIDERKNYTGLQIFGMVLTTLIIAPIATPIILGIEIGQAIKEKNN